ncbi:MAG: pyridoxamine 5'-phosphate oxidase family protein [Anaerolineae bacterium]|nr:pyridoxamine 5'-phosphate oxidase family protein [Anaerolineae bacterium]
MDHDFDIDQFLQRPLMAHLATMSKDGARESPVWFLWEANAIWLIGNTRDSFPKRIQDDGRCAIGIVDFDLEGGVLKHIGLRGNATVVPLDQERLYRLLRRYLGDDQTAWSSWFRTNIIDGLDLMVHFIPTSIVARDQSYFAETGSRE